MGATGSRLLIIALAMLLDAALGEPKWLWSRLPHPAVLMGRLIGWIDTNWNSGTHQKAKGIIAMTALVSGALLLGLALMALPGQLVDLVVLAILLAQRSLSDHVLNVARALRQSLPEGRRAVAMIVGRDTADMTDASVARSAIESAAENLSDGVVAPLFWFAVGGLPGLLIYKVTNTADSMIGYLTPRHARFGWAAARLDDLLNYIPARLTALAMVMVTWRWDVMPSVRTEAPLHRSPNAGWPEAALAHVLDFALSGPRQYDGELRDYPFVNARGIRELGPEHIEDSVKLMWKTWGLLLIPAVIAALI